MKTGPSQDDQTLCGGFSIHAWEQVAAETITNTWNSIGLQGWQVEEAGGGGRWGRGTIKKASKCSGCGGFPHLLHKI